MPRDLALNFELGGDWVFTGHRDLQLVDGPALIKQRIMVRLFIQKPWDYDPSRGSLGSRLHEMLHYPRARALQELELVVREALEPLREVRVVKCDIDEQVDERQVNIHITYEIIDEFSVFSEGSQQTLSFQLFG